MTLRARSADPRVKLGVALVALGACLAAPRVLSVLVLAFCALAAVAASRGDRIPWRALAAAWGLGAAAAALRAFLTPGNALWVIPVAGRALAISDAGLAQGAAVLSRVLATTLVAAWLTSTTPFPHLVAALAWARVPAALLDLLLLAHRHRHALRDSLETVRCAQTLRLGYVGLRRSAASAGVLAGAAVCRALDQAGATAEAMQLRGDRGAAALTLPECCPAADAFVVGYGAAALMASAALAWGSPW